MAKEARDFLNTLFGEPEQQFILLWRLADKSSHWFRDVDAAAAFAEKEAARDIYVGVSLAPAEFGPDYKCPPDSRDCRPGHPCAAVHRCPADHSAGIAALWCDIDVAGAGHTKQNLAPTIEAARSLLPEVLPPSIIIHSGGGIQCWWLLKEPWLFETDEERSRGAQLARRWVNMLRARSHVRGWDSVDPVGDLARVMRLPGTMNTKAGGKRPVTILEANDRRYNQSELSDYLDIVGTPVPSEVAVAAAGDWDAVYDPNADPSMVRMQVMFEAEPRFQITWERRRKDLKDQSGSSYDFALANYAILAGWSNQDIVNMLIAHRKMHKDDLKLRPTSPARDGGILSYYKRTIEQARATLINAQAQAAAAEATEDLARDRVEVRPEDDDATPLLPAVVAAQEEQRKATIVEHISGLFGFEVRRVIRYVGEPPTYSIETACGTVALGGVENLIDQGRLRHKLAAHVSKLIPMFKAERWMPVAQSLLNACVDVELGEDSTQEGMMSQMVDAYLAHGIARDLESGISSRNAFCHDDAVWLLVTDFRSWLASNGDPMEPRKATELLRRIGAVPAKINSVGRANRTSRSAWRIPAGPGRPTEPTERVAAEQYEEAWG